MLNLKSFTIASAALTLFSSVSASGLYPVKRTQQPAQPSCTDFTPFKYAGCFVDNGSPRTLLYTGPRLHQNQTVEGCVAFCKGNGYQYAGLEYGEQCFCGASVNNVQTDEADCDFSCTGDRTEVCGGSNRVSIYQDPTFPVVDPTTISDYQKLGCYQESTMGRSLAWRQDQVNATTMTVEGCLTACKAGGYSFSGLEFASECYCGVVLGNGTLPVDSSKCDMPCKGDATETCGGRKTLDLYVAKDLESSEPCEGGSSSSSSSVVSSTSSSSSSSSTNPPSTTSSSTSTSSSLSSSTVSSTSTTSSSSSSSVTSTSTTSSSSSSTSSSTSSTASSTTSKSTSTSFSSTSTTKPPTSSSTPPTSTAPTTTTSKTASLCTSTTTIAPTPACEYKCGKWCSNPLPKFTDKNACWSAFSSCTVQVASCFLNAGFPESMKCFEFSNWCTSVSSYCSSYCPGNNCSKEGCRNKYPPSGPSVPAPSVSTSVYPCPAPTAKPSTTSTTASSTTVVPIPTDTNICKQPHNPGKGYSSSAPVGSIELPRLTCNNVYNEYKSGYPFKLYTSPQSKNCPSYPRGGNNGPTQACKDACDTQYRSCIDTYAQSCKNGRRNQRRGDSYDTATQKCKSQWYDCYNANSNVQPGNRCGSWNSGWY
ncbi:WSC domain-containing protein [Rhexocercosporidium sp. MPI-PUGE-AT-0058]|nr:WSC domain-containing protein [Rhexocercosporidium sp. MPI-PUGE-AT-0058]